MASRIGVLVAICSLALASDARALNMYKGNVAVEDLTAWGFINATNGEVLSWDSGTTNEMYETFGYLGNPDGLVRVDSNNFDLVGSFDDLDGDGVATANLSLNATGASDLNLSVGDILITHTFSLVDSPGASDEGLIFDVTVANDSGGALSFNYYQYADINAAGVLAGDSAYGDASGITVEDATGARTYWRADGGVDAYEVGAQVSNKLDAGNKWRDLNNKGLPFGPNKDFKGAKQINVRDLQDQDFSFVRWRIVKGPEPGTALLLGLGLGILGLVGRRRRLVQAG